jgi:arylsulfatase A-like enzyme
MPAQKPSVSWASLYMVTFLTATLYGFMEWLFTITRPSYLSELAFINQLGVLFFASAFLAGLGLLILTPLLLLGLLPRFRRDPTLLIKIGALVPAGICAALILILVDNFTYTLFKFGVVSTAGVTRLLYGLGFLLVLILCYRRLLSLLGTLSLRLQVWPRASRWILSLLSLWILVWIALPIAWASNSKVRSASASSATQRPHIILITSDGVNATNMSVYGYERDTTPFLSRLAESALVAENAFSNAGPTAGSIFSIYTGKYPAATRMLYPPDILKGSDSYQHLPSILRSLGYTTVQIAVPYFVDAYQQNLLDGFDEANGRLSTQNRLLIALSQVFPGDYAFFSYDTTNRIADRVRHIFFIKQIDDPLAVVTGPPQQFADRQRMARLQQVLRSAQGPVFIHIHLMGTHGDTFNPSKQFFSSGQAVDDQQSWNVDFYDDSILELDNNISGLVDYLTELGMFDQTILIIGSDHGQKWDQVRRIPLIIRFPNGEFAERLLENVQNLDIAPTILDYIGLDQPGWMPGKSLITGDVDQRPIIGVSAQGQEPNQKGQFAVNYDKVRPPFYQLGEITLIVCGDWYQLNLTDLSWESGTVEGSTTGCPAGSKITPRQAYQQMVSHLEDNGFDVSSLEQTLPEIP